MFYQNIHDADQIYEDKPGGYVAMLRGCTDSGVSGYMRALKIARERVVEWGYEPVIYAQIEYKSAILPFVSVSFVSKEAEENHRAFEQFMENAMKFKKHPLRSAMDVVKRARRNKAHPKFIERLEERAAAAGGVEAGVSLAPLMCEIDRGECKVYNLKRKHKERENN